MVCAGLELLTMSMIIIPWSVPAPNPQVTWFPPKSGIDPQIVPGILQVFPSLNIVSVSCFASCEYILDSKLSDDIS